MYSFWFKANNFNSRFYFSKAGFPKLAFFFTFGNKKRLKKNVPKGPSLQSEFTIPPYSEQSIYTFARLARASFADVWLNQKLCNQARNNLCRYCDKKCIHFKPPDFINSDGLLQNTFSPVTHQSLLNYTTIYSW